MKISKITQVLALAGASIAIPNTSQAALIFELKEVGPNVVLTMLAGGSLDTTGLSPGGFQNVSFYSAGGTLDPSWPTFSVGGSGSVDTYIINGTATTFSGPLSFGAGGSNVSASIVSGDFFAFDNGLAPGTIYLPDGYLSGSSVAASSATFNNTTLSRLGADDGTYVWTLPNTDTITLRVGSASTVPGGSASTVPDAGGSVAGLGLAVAGLIHLRRRRQNTVTA